MIIGYHGSWVELTNGTYSTPESPSWLSERTMAFRGKVWKMGKHPRKIASGEYKTHKSQGHGRYRRALNGSSQTRKTPISLPLKTNHPKPIQPSLHPRLHHLTPSPQSKQTTPTRNRNPINPLATEQTDPPQPKSQLRTPSHSSFQPHTPPSRSPTPAPSSITSSA